MKSRFGKILRGVGGTLSLPVLVYCFFALLCAANGKSGFGVGSDLGIIWRNTIYSGLISLALSFNLTSGRFDFSVGSILILSVILGVDTALALGWGPLPLLLACLAFGALLGLLSGLAYVLLRLPPIVVSIGVAMIYEAIAFLLNGGRGVSVIMHPELPVFASPGAIALLAAVIVAFLVVLTNFTKFGYNSNSLRSGQATAVNIGIDEKRNALACYSIAGSLMAAAGAISLSILGTMTPKLSLGSSSYMMNAFLPLFLGGFLARFSDRNVGIVAGAFVQACIISGFAILGLSVSLQSVLNTLIVLAFLLFTANSYKLEEFRLMKAKRLSALSARG